MTCEPPIDCIIVDCDIDGICCEPDVCEVQPDGSELCLPCDENSQCIPDIRPCCSGMFCYLGFCKNCENFPCVSHEECCPDYECGFEGGVVKGLCEPCDRPCPIDEWVEEVDPCCNNWECSEEYQCENCDRPCINDLDCCANGACNPVTLRCEGCEDGAYCNEELPCCESYECNLDTNRCESCLDRPCNTKEDCCVDGFCNPITNLCQYGSDCEGNPCSPERIGELCLVDPTCDPSVEDCVVCKDETYCIPTGIGAVCKSNICPKGQIPCSSLNIPLEKEDCVCCYLDGKCADSGLQECKVIENCVICACVSFTVPICPPNTYYCPNLGCFNPNDVTYTFTDNVACIPCATNPDACCTYYVPSEALPMEVSRSEFCLSGYYSNIRSKCIDYVRYFEVDSLETLYLYRFVDVANQEHFERESTVPPTEVVLSTVNIPTNYDCNYINNNFDIEFSEPILFEVKGD